MWLPLPTPAILLKYLYIGWNTKEFCVSSSSKWLVALNKSNQMFLAFLIHFQMFCFICSNFLLSVDSLASKSVFVTKFACSNLALKTSAAKVLNSGVVIYLSWLWSVRFFSVSVIFAS